MSAETVFQRLPVGRPVSVGSVGRRGFTVMLAAGIVNPMGPTLAVVAVDGPFDEGARLPVIAMSLNPFRQGCQVVGEVSIGETWDPVEDASIFFPDVPLQGCPSVLLPSIWLEESDAVALYARFLMRFDDGAELFAGVRRFPGDPIARVQAEMDRAFSGMAGKGREGTPGSRPREGRLERNAASSLAAMLLESGANKAELRAFVLAWRGSIEHQAGSRLEAMSFATFADLFARLAETCTVPA